MADRKLRVALIGCGLISLYHLRAWRSAGVEIVAVCDTDRSKAEARAKEFDISRIYSAAADMFAHGGFDAVDIAASVNAHAPMVRMAANFGVHVMVQKPMCATVEEAKALVDEVGDRVRFMVHENYRFRPHYITVRRWVDEGRIGKIRHAAISCRGSGLCEREGTVPFLIERQPYLKSFNRNIVFETMIHHLDVLRCLVGPLRVISARLNRLAEGLPGEDTAAILMEGEGGLIATADGSLCAPGYPQLHGDRLEVIGTRGTIVMELNRVFLVGRQEETMEEVDLLGRYQECFNTAMQAFMAGLNDGTPFETDRLDNLETLKLMESVYRAAGVEIHP